MQSMLYMVVTQAANLQTQRKEKREMKQQEPLHRNNELEYRRRRKAAIQQTRDIHAQKYQPISE